MSFAVTGFLLALSLLAADSAHGSCSSPANQIEAENCLPGNPSSEWDVSGAGDLTIQGFATDISVNVGGTIYFKINTDASAYTIDIYRIGYYAGTGARLVASISPSVTLPQTQPACVTDTTVGLTDCGNWAVSASWQVPSNATSGVYLAHLVRSDTGGDSHIVFIVRNDSSHSDILIQTSDETWQAYNYYGSGSLYGPGTTTFDLTNRSKKVSYNRPFLTRSFGSETATWVFGAEYPLIQWLESNGYDVTYFTGMDAERYGSLVQNHKVYISSGHDEYVSGSQRNNIQTARDAGINLAFFSGNEVFWKTRWENSIDGSSTPYRTLVCYKETLGPNSNPAATAAVDPMDPPIWTGTWRDPTKSPPADGGRPENALTGTIFMVNGPGNDNDGSLTIKVPAADGQMRFWRGTAIASLPSTGTYTLPQGTLGYEWDEDLDNGARPAGAFRLSTVAYTLTNDLLLDYGGTYGAGTATHHMMMYRAPSGALVFGSGTVQWSWGLNSQHDNPFGFGNPDPDVNMQQASVNLLADMGVQPATLQPGLQLATQSTDTTPPVSTITSPASGANVNTGSPVTVSGTAADSGGGVVAGVEVSTDGGQTWHPTTGRQNWNYSWVPSVVGTVALQSRAVDDSGNLENPQISGGNPQGGFPINVNPAVCPCSIWGSVNAPNNVDSGDASAVEVGVKFRTDNDGVITGLRFYKASSNTGTHVGHLWTSSGALLATATFTGESVSGWQEVQFGTPIPVTANTVYVASYFAPTGHYSADVSYFSKGGYDDPPVHALANGVSGANGVYVYTAAPGPFPETGYEATNYWVDIVFVSGSTFDIAGNISGIGGFGATVELTGTINTVTTTDSSGNYQFAGLVDGTYTVRPSNPGVGFTPASQAIAINGLSSYNVNFNSVATNPLSLSGTISGSGGPGTIISLSGPASLSTTADSSGSFSFNGLIPGIYLVTPFEAGYVFAPESQTVTLVSANATGVNFTGQACTCSTIWQPTAMPVVADGGDGHSVEVGVKFRADFAGTIQALRFYKASANTGTHIGHIWSGSGILLGSATFTNETAFGWQEVVFNPPIRIASNTVYVASYFAPAGHYSADVNYFQAAGVDNPPLHALADGSSGPDGVYSYGASPAFPSSGFSAANYWVDIVFAPSPTHNLSGTITGAAGPGATVTLSGGSAVTTTADGFGNFSFTNVHDGTYVLTPNQLGYAFTSASQTVTVSGADIAGVTFATLPNCTPCDSIWQSTAAPVVADTGDARSVNLGVKFRSDSDGYVIGLRFYKSALNSGEHVGTLWSSTGTLLGSVTFSDESQFGWQQALFPAPIPVLANTTYVVAYLAPAGNYAGDNSYFASSGANNPPLHALANGVDGPNGLFEYGSTVVFPSNTYQASNYWVDVLFTPTGPTHAISGTITGPGGPNATVTLGGGSNAIVTADASGNYSFAGLADGGYWVTPSQPGYVFDDGVEFVTVSGADVTGVDFGTVQSCPCNTIWPLSATPTIVDSGDGQSVNIGLKFRADSDGYVAGLRFYKSALNTGIHVGALWSDTGTQIATATFTEESASGWQQVLFDAAVPITANTTYVVSYLAPAGHYAADANYFASSGIDNPPLHALASGVDGPNGVYAYSSTTTFPNLNYQSDNYWVDVIYAGTGSYSVAGTISGPGGPGATVTLTGPSTATTIADASGNYSFSGLVNGNYTVTPKPGLYTFNPGSQSVTVNNAHVLNVTFASGFAISGTIGGSAGAGATVNLTGTSNATATADGSGNYSFTGLANGSYTVVPSNTNSTFTPASQAVTVNSASVGGINFSQTFSIAGTISGLGGAGATVNLTGASNATITADGSGNYSFTGLTNGSYTVTPGNTGYVVAPASQAVTINGTSATANFTSAVLTYSISGTISGTGGPSATVILTGTATASITADSSGSYNFSGLSNGPYTVTVGNTGYVFTPASQTALINGISFSGLNFATVSGCPTCDTIWPVSAAPVVIDSGDSNATELGVKVRVDNDGYVTGLRFYKASTNAGTHVAHLWTSTGTQLGKAIFSGESSTGWQQVLFTTPIPVVANTTYVASYFAPSGHYSADANFFANGGVDTLPLHALANSVDGPDGVYVYTQTGGFPTATNQASNYWVDVVYNNGLGYSIVGTLSGPGGAGATVNLTGAATATTTADANGNYSFDQLSNGSYTVTPSNTGYVFTPTSQSVTINGAHAMNVNFISPLQTYSISGTISGPGGPGASVSLGGASTATTSADGFGNYTFTGLATGSYTVTPSNGSYAFSPASQTTTISGSNISAFNFSSLLVASITVSPSSVVGGGSSTGTVTINAPAPAGGAVVALSSSNTSAAQVPASVTVAASATSATFTITTNPVATNTSLTISTTYGATQNASFTVTAPVLSSVSLSPASVLGGSSSTGTVTLSGPAPAGGAAVALSSSNTSVAQVPASVTVAANATTATFTVTTSVVLSNTALNISATDGLTQSASLSVTTGSLSTVTVNPASVVGGTSSTGTVTLAAAAPTGGTVVTLSSGNTAAAQVPASVTVASGTTTATFTVTTNPVTSNVPVTISGTYGVTKSSALTVTASVLSSLTFSSNPVVGGNTPTGTVTLNGPAPAGGAVVTLSSNNPAVAQVSAPSVTVAANSTTAVFTVTTSTVANNTIVAISATYGATKTTNLTVNAPTLSSVTLSPTSVVGGNASTGTVTLNGAAPAGGVVVTLSSNNPTAAQVPASVSVAANAKTGTFSVATSPQASNTPVTISGTYGATKTATLTVTSAVLSSVTLSPSSVIGGNTSTGTVSLNGQAPAGGAVVTLSSGNTTAALVPASVTVAGNATTATFTVTTSPEAANTSAAISGTYGTTHSATLTVLAAVVSSVTLSPTSVLGGNSSTANVTLSRAAPSGGAVVTLSTTNTAAAAVPASVTVPANATTATFTVTTSPVAVNTAVTISATYGATKTGALTVTTATLSSITFSPTSVIGSTSSTGTVTLNGPAPASGAVVTLSSSNTTAAQAPATVTVPGNATTTTFTVTTNSVAANTAVTITATRGTTHTAVLIVAAPTLSTFTLSPTTVRGTSPSTGTVTLSGPAPTAGTVVTLSSSLTSVATVPANVTVAAGSTSAAFTVTTKAVATTTAVTISATKGSTLTAILTVTP